MSYVLTDGPNIKVYPYNIGLLRRDNPNVSFPASMSDAQLAEWNVFEVASTPVPAFNPLTHKAAEVTPVNSNGWHQAWTLEALTDYEAAQARDDAMFNLRDERTKRLAETDWTQMADAPITPEQKAAFVAYRQQLRDLPKNTTDLLNPIWPVEPKV